MAELPMHPLLARQLKRCFGAFDAAPTEARALIDVVNQAYHQADVDRRMLERSLELSSEELRDANRSLGDAVRDLQAAHRDMERRVDDRTRELAEAHEHLRHAQKMEAIGTLAGGIAHDFNNLLMVIDGSTEILLMSGRSGDAARPELDEIRRAADRAAELTQQLLAFGRRQVLTPRTLDLNTVVLNMRRMLSRVVREDIEIIAEAAPQPAWVRLDANQIEQVLLNMVLNARDALPDGGYVRIAVDREAGATPGALGVVRLSVSDNGIGMPPEVQSRVFEPFFSTKEGRGSGLGLASVHGIVHQSNGRITVRSVPAEGTTFTMTFPEVPPGVPGQETVHPFPATVRRSDVVLLVEDEDPVRRMFTRLIKLLGYEVVEAATPHEACGIFEADPQAVDLLVTDVIMPAMNGPTMARRFLELRPDLPVLFVSGHADVDLSLMGLDRPGLGFLAKPARLHQLAAKIAEVLAGIRQLGEREHDE